MPVWNPWHGCHKYSEGCQNCYVYRRDESIGKDASVVQKTKAFADPLKRTRSGEYKLPYGSEIDACFTSDFFVEEADAFRDEAWKMIRIRRDAQFFILTKRIVRFSDCVPADWGGGYPNVTIGCTVENQKQADLRLPLFRELPIRHRFVNCEPLLGAIRLEPVLGPWAEFVSVGGESGPNARLCDYAWVLDIRAQCLRAGVPFRFRQTGALFKKGAAVYAIPRKWQQPQARKANIDT